MLVSDFDYQLPPQLIAQEPLADRAASRMLVLHRAEQRWEDRHFRDLPEYLHPGDCLVLNNSRVFPSRLLGHREGFTGKCEVFLVRPTSDDGRTWEALVHPGRKLRSGDRVVFSEDLSALIVGRGERGLRSVRIESRGDLMETIERTGHIPLPPYIERPDRAEDRDRYQTVFAKERGSVAAPTAGLHFTPEVLDACSRAGAAIAYVTLHVGLGTFQPLNSDVVEQVKLHEELYSAGEHALDEIARAKRVVAVGTTSVRTLETYARTRRRAGETNLYIYPGFEFQLTGAMLTNFHLPKSSLLLLVCAFGGTKFVMDAYRHAVSEKYRFFSYGDCMLIL